MKKLMSIIGIVLALLLAFGVTVAFAGEGDPQPDVGFRVLDTDCGLAQFGSTPTWWWATYSNGTGILKCIGHTDNPPAVVTIIPEYSCNTPAGPAASAFFKVFPDGQVHLVCKK